MQPTYLSRAQFRTLRAVAELVIQGEPELLTPDEIVGNVDRYLARFPSPRKFIAKLALTGLEWYPVLLFHRRLSRMPAAARLRFIRRKFERDVVLRRISRPIRILVQAMIRFAKQLAYVGYYGDPRTFGSVGYVPYSRRTGRPQPPRVTVALEVTPPESLPPALDANVCIIGSGAGGAMLAQALGEQGVRDILIVERGPFVQPSAFTEDELDMLARLYSDGALQLTRDFRLQVLQGSCVGGTTVVNNAVCFDLPAPVLARWNDARHAAGLDAVEFQAAFRAVRSLLDITTQPPLQLNRGARKFVDGVRALRLDQPPHRYDIVEANIADCLGCGYCNIGCAYGRKLSMLDRVLPRAQHDHGLRVIERCDVQRLDCDGRTATAAVARLPTGRTLRIRANKFVVSCGALASSHVLRQSRLGGPNVGRRVSLNLGSPLHAGFKDEILDSYDGLQISHYLIPGDGESGFVLETWYNPPLAQAQSMPGWFERHFDNMRAFNRLTAAGVLVGTESNGRASRGLFGRDIVYEPTPGDLEKLRRGLALLGKIYFAAGADRVMPATFRYYEWHNERELAQLWDVVRDASDIMLGSGHPQGGNAISAQDDRGVVTPEFRVRGTRNVYVCDASVFPTSIGVNPQLTVMALARYAAPRIAWAGPR